MNTLKALLLTSILFISSLSVAQTTDWNAIMQSYGPQLQASYQSFVQLSGMPVSFQDYVSFLVIYQQPLSTAYQAFIAQQGQVSFEQFLVYQILANQRMAQSYPNQPYAGQIPGQAGTSDPYASQAYPSSPNSASAEQFGLYIRGNGYYTDPYSGEVVELPYAPDMGTSYDVGGSTYSMDTSGYYSSGSGDVLSPYTPTDSSSGE